jgi:diacylglycerol kinase
MKKYSKNLWLWLSLSIVLIVIQFFLDEKEIIYIFLTVSITGLLMNLFKFKRIDKKE